MREDSLSGYKAERTADGFKALVRRRDIADGDLAVLVSADVGTKDRCQSAGSRLVGGRIIEPLQGGDRPGDALRTDARRSSRQSRRVPRAVLCRR